MNFIELKWPAPTSIKAFTTVRNSFNGVEKETTAAQLQALFNLPQTPILFKQTHSTIALEATPDNQNKIADASFTREENRVCVIMTADCLPLFICNKAGTEVAVIHAGWRGLAAGIIENTIHALSSAPEDLLVFLGPAIGPQKFEVGKDVYDAFVVNDLESQQAFTTHRPEKWLANLYLLAKIRLKRLNITAIYGGDFCTYSQENLFFSYRRDQGITGRMASLIWINKS